MFNAEKLLGGLLRQGLKGNAPAGDLFSAGGLFSSKAALGLGLLGLAWEAAEHVLGQTQGEPGESLQSRGSVQSRPPVPPAPSAQGLPPAPPPPPLSPARPSAPPVSPSALSPDAPAAPDPAAVVCLQAMIAAAWADGSLDGQERTSIFQGLDSLQLTPEETAFLHRELAAPKSAAEIAALASQLPTSEAAQAVYAAACMAIVADTAAEHAFLDELAARLHLDPSIARSLKRQ
ncbi:hypothetical protein JCM14635_31260 [Megalodesulfovibrio paquesii]